MMHGQKNITLHVSRRSKPAHSVRDFSWTKRHWDRFFSSTSVFPSREHSTNALYSSSSTCCSYRMDKRAKPGNLQKSSGLF